MYRTHHLYYPYIGVLLNSLLINSYWKSYSLPYKIDSHTSFHTEKCMHKIIYSMQKKIHLHKLYCMGALRGKAM